MPFTPIHLGAGLAFKGVGGRHFSFMVFGGSQVLMDIEPLIGILRGWDVLHGYSHTLAGATVIGGIAGLVGRPISEFALQKLRIRHAPFTWTASFIGAYAGTISHIALDAIMHADMAPFWPLRTGNPWLGLISIDALHLLCLALALLGGALLAGRALIARKHGATNP